MSAHLSGERSPISNLRPNFLEILSRSVAERDIRSEARAAPAIRTSEEVRQLQRQLDSLTEQVTTLKGRLSDQEVLVDEAVSGYRAPAKQSIKEM